MRVTVPSYGRAGKCETTAWLKDYLLVVPESQWQEYKKFYPAKNVMAIPDKEDGNIFRKRNAILKYVDDKHLFVIDDDIRKVIHLPSGRVLSPSEFMSRVYNGFVMCEDLNTKLFGFNHTSDPMKFHDFQPFSLTKQFYFGTGIIKTDLRYDESLGWGDDVDFWLQHLNRYRKTLRFNLYYLMPSASKKGGIGVQDDKRNYGDLIKKWGSKIVGYKKGKFYVHSPIKGI